MSSLAPIDPLVAIPAALSAVGLSPDSAQGSLTAALPALRQPLTQGFSVQCDAEFTALWVRCRVTDLSARVPPAFQGSFPLPSGPGVLGIGQRAGLGQLSLAALWEAPEGVVEASERLTALGFTDTALMAHKRMLGRLKASKADRIGMTTLRPGAESTARFEVDSHVDASGVRGHAEQLGLAARLFSAPMRQLEWFFASLPALAPRPTNLITAAFELSTRGVKPALHVRVPDLPISSVLTLYRQFSLLEEGAASRLGALSAALGRDDELIDWLQITLTNEDAPRFAVQMATRNL